MRQMFRTVNRLRSGYDPDQVDTFFTHARSVYEGDRTEPLDGADVRKVAFDLVHGGYATASVDSALDRLERAFAVAYPPWTRSNATLRTSAPYSGSVRSPS